jgi:[acyl-carrier-protein] S-malonyltransferase
MKLDADKTTFVFPGQGSQSVGMGHDLAGRYPVARQIFEQADSILGFELSKLMWAGPEADLNDTVNTQPALYVHSLAAFRVFKDLHPEFTPAALAGHSLGELSALSASEALSFEEGLSLVRTRGELMKLAGERRPGSMAAILNLDILALEKVCAQASSENEPVQVANDNGPGQVVISGAQPAVERAMTLAKAAGAKRAIPLPISIAAHSPLMGSIQGEWDQAVNSVTMQDPKVLILSNVTVRAMRTAAELRSDIQAQMQSRVRWTETVQHLAEKGTSHFVEFGPGTVLLGLIRRIVPTIPGFALGNPPDFTVLE